MRLGRFLPRCIMIKMRTYLSNLLSPIVREVINQTSTPQVSDIEALLRQSLSTIHHELNIPPVPPKHLQVRVVGGYVPGFIESGFQTFEDLNEVLKTAGKSLNDFESILDFGCGCGRNIRALRTRLPAATLCGMDIDGEAIGWLTQHYRSFGTFTVAPHNPPTALEDSRFDFIFGISVFTHLPEDLQFAWLEELRRISKPGGYLVLTTHGENHYKNMDSGILKIMKSKGFFYIDSGYGQRIELPEFYQNTYHSHDYVRREWEKYFDILDIRALGMGNHQDTVLMRNRR